MTNRSSGLTSTCAICGAAYRCERAAGAASCGCEKPNASGVQAEERDTGCWCPACVASVETSPCIGHCTLDPETEQCRGCLRSIEEIMAWSQLSRPERKSVVRRVRSATPIGDETHGHSQ